MWARTEPTVDLSKQLTTWLLPFIFTLPNQTQYVAKAGNKAYGLSSNFPNTVGNGYGPTFGSTELALKRKYRYKRCPFRVITLYIFLLPTHFLQTIFFYIFYSTIFPVSDYFFLLKISDWSKEYKPESKILMDIPSALNFFHKDPKFTLSMITSKVEKLANGWNSVFYKTDKEVCTNKHRFLTKNPYNVFQKVNYCFKIYLFVISDYAHPVTLF